MQRSRSAFAEVYLALVTCVFLAPSDGLGAVADLQVKVALRTVCASAQPTEEAGAPRPLAASLTARITVKPPRKARIDILTGDCANHDWCSVRLHAGSVFAFDGVHSTSWFGRGRSFQEHPLPPPNEHRKYVGPSRSYLGQVLWSMLLTGEALLTSKRRSDQEHDDSSTVPFSSPLLTLSGRRAVRARFAPEVQSADGTVVEVEDAEGTAIARNRMTVRSSPAGPRRVVHSEITQGLAPCLIEVRPSTTTNEHADDRTVVNPPPGEVKELQRWFNGRLVETELKQLSGSLWVPLRITVKDLEGNLRLTAEFTDYRLNTGVPDSFFDLSALATEAKKGATAGKDAGGK